MYGDMEPLFTQNAVTNPEFFVSRKVAALGYPNTVKCPVSAKNKKINK